MTDPTYPYIPASLESDDDWRPASQVRQLVIHTAEHPLYAGAARSVGGFFKPHGMPSETHYGADNLEIIQYAPDLVECDGAAGGNTYSLHIELCTYARTSRATWLGDAAHKALLVNAARWCEHKGRQFGIPNQYVSATMLSMDRATPGVTRHVDFSTAFGLSSHWDPGPGFPMDVLLDLVNRLRVPPRPVVPEDTMIIRQKVHLGNKKVTEDRKPFARITPGETQVVLYNTASVRNDTPVKSLGVRVKPVGTEKNPILGAVEWDNDEGFSVMRADGTQVPVYWS